MSKITSKAVDSTQEMKRSVLKWRNDSVISGLAASQAEYETLIAITETNTRLSIFHHVLKSHSNSEFAFLKV